MAKSVVFKQSHRIKIKRPGEGSWFQWGGKSWRNLGETQERLVTPTASIDSIEAWAKELADITDAHMLFVWSVGPSGVGSVYLTAVLKSEDPFDKLDSPPCWGHVVKPPRTRYERLREDDSVLFDGTDLTRE